MLEDVNKLKDENVLIVHGTADGGFLVKVATVQTGCYFLARSIFCVCVCVSKSKSPLPAQRGAAEPPGEGGGQLLPPAIPR